MEIELSTPEVDGLREVLSPLREWQRDGSPIQLHPGDVGWLWRLGDVATAAALRTWSRDGQIVAIGMLDGPDLLRFALSPEALHDEEVARHLVADVTEPERGVLPAGRASVEAPPGALVHDLLGEADWSTDEPWAMLRRDLSEPVEDPGVRVEEVGPDQARGWIGVHRSAFGASHLTEELLVERWHAMAAGMPYAEARCLLGYDDEGNAVAAVVVWAAGPGRYGLVEPLGVHQDHQGHGHGKAIAVAGAAALRKLGSSAALVITPGDNAAGVGAYRSAGFGLVSERRDRRRDAA